MSKKEDDQTSYEEIIKAVTFQASNSRVEVENDQQQQREMRNQLRRMLENDQRYLVVSKLLRDPNLRTASLSILDFLKRHYLLLTYPQPGSASSLSVARMSPNYGVQAQRVPWGPIFIIQDEWFDKTIEKFPHNVSEQLEWFISEYWSKKKILDIEPPGSRSPFRHIPDQNDELGLALFRSGYFESLQNHFKFEVILKLNPDNFTILYRRSFNGNYIEVSDLTELLHVIDDIVSDEAQYANIISSFNSRAANVRSELNHRIYDAEKAYLDNFKRRYSRAIALYDREATSMGMPPISDVRSATLLSSDIQAIIDSIDNFIFKVEKNAASLKLDTDFNSDQMRGQIRALIRR